MAGREVRALLESLRDVCEVSRRGEVTVRHPGRLDTGTIDRLAARAVFGTSEETGAARWLLRELARLEGLLPASIQPLYEAMGRGEVGGFTTPALNLRGLTYDTARAAIRALLKLDAGPVVFELARSEMGYTFQTPSEYAALLLAAALREGYRGPLFIQGDHFQVNAKKFHAGGEVRETEMRALRELVQESITAGFYNIDIDASTLVVLERAGLREQQRDNVATQAELTDLVRRLQPPGLVISVGGEIGEVGGKNSTPEELRAFMDGLREDLAGRDSGAPGISKVSIQTGTTHGGVPLPDGSVAKVTIDFECLRTISEVARREYGLAGAVQHGASTLPAEAFGEFPGHGAAEVHLATEFQNIVLDHPEFPRPLRDEIDGWLGSNCAGERRPGMTDEQFRYKTRKKAWGPFKAQVWGLPEATRAALRESLQAKFDFLFRRLGVAGGRDLVERHVRPVEIRTPPPAALTAAFADSMGR
ncbi:MAG TPA: class II fructose-bisphosphate aldolase [Candidatus Polarisedimenticolia bacterium]|nr:class II fructose-bisphosphate aldolase [Candidatus Polarisedimenticolia bacterium]